MSKACTRYVLADYLKYGAFSAENVSSVHISGFDWFAWMSHCQLKYFMTLFSIMIMYISFINTRIQLTRNRYLILKFKKFQLCVIYIYISLKDIHIERIWIIPFWSKIFKNYYVINNNKFIYYNILYLKIFLYFNILFTTQNQGRLCIFVYYFLSII